MRLLIYYVFVNFTKFNLKSKSSLIKLLKLFKANTAGAIFVTFCHDFLQLCFRDLKVLIKDSLQVLLGDEVSLFLVEYSERITYLLIQARLAPAVRNSALNKFNIETSSFRKIGVETL